MHRKELADKLRQQKSKIIERWTHRVRREIPAAAKQEKLALLDSLTALLDHLADTMAGGCTRQSRAESEIVAFEHGCQRFSLADYSLPQVIGEYRIMRSVIFEALTPPPPLPFAIIHLVNDELDQGIANAAMAFASSEHAQDQQEVARLTDENKVSRELLTNRDQIMAELSHDLRSPLSTAKMTAEIMLRELERRPGAAELIEILLRNLDHAEVLLTDLLDVGRFQAHRRIALHPESTDLTKLVRDIVSEMSRHSDGARLHYETAEQVQGYWCPSALRRLLVNLLSNAIKYGDCNKTITVRLRQDANEVVLAVHNFGQPISSTDQTHLFEAFTRSHVAESGKNKGWGLGLAVVKAIAEAHGGMVSVASSAEDGTTFTVKVPNDIRAVAAP